MMIIAMMFKGKNENIMIEIKEIIEIEEVVIIIDKEIEIKRVIVIITDEEIGIEGITRITEITGITGITEIENITEIEKIDMIEMIEETINTKEEIIIKTLTKLEEIKKYSIFLLFFIL
jgi:hypothetical protein